MPCGAETAGENCPRRAGPRHGFFCWVESEKEHEMRPDNPNFRPCAMYKFRQWENKEPVHVGFGAVGPGWHPILAELDRKFVEILGPRDHSKIEILQIKEKFGGLCVYYVQNPVDLGKGTLKKIRDAVDEAERKSLKTCEKCGSKQNVETKGHMGRAYSRVLTLCPIHHKERAASDNFRIGSSTVM